MDIITVITDIFQNPLLIGKAVILVVLILYTIFSFVVYNQTRTMNKAFTQATSSPILEFIALLQFFAGASLFIFALVIL